jgi:hypothetical protein
MTDREAMKLALFALDIVKIHYTQSRHVNEAIAALKERNENERLGLYRDAYAEQEPVAVYGYCLECGAKGVQRERRPDGNDKCAKDPSSKATTAPQPAQRTEQEPDYWLGYGLQAQTEKPFENATALYKDPPQRTWVGLTDEQFNTIEKMALTKNMAIAMTTSTLKVKNQ